MNDEIKALMDAAQIVRDTRVDLAAGPTVIWQKLDRVERYIRARIDAVGLEAYGALLGSEMENGVIQ